MPTQDTSEIKEMILKTLRIQGPRLPVHIARETGLSILFASAFLSELLSEKKIKISNMRVGSSPLYFIPGQEFLLSKFSQHLKSKEKEAFILLEEKKFLKDRGQDPAIRVALRAIKDFAIPFERNKELFWRYFTVKEDELKIKEPQVKEITTAVLRMGELGTLKEKTTKEKSSELNIFGKTLIKKTAKKKPQKEKSEFVLNVLNLLNRNNFSVHEEVGFKKREYNAIININSDIGVMKFFLQAKDKKNVSVGDLMDLVKTAKNKNLPALFLYSGELNKRAHEYALENNYMLKVKRLG